MIRRFVVWFWRAWPIIVMALLTVAHLLALASFQTESVLVNKLTGTFMQIIGGLIILYSVDSNLGLFRNKSLSAIVIAWFRQCPLFTRSVTVSGSASATFSISASATGSVFRVTTTVEERLTEVERRLQELSSEIATQKRALHLRIEEVQTKLSSSIASNQSFLDKLNEKIENVTVGGFKQQAFGVMLVIYGAVTSVFA
jgi:uncharacterized coiled-coil protein SlyX